MDRTLKCATQQPPGSIHVAGHKTKSTRCQAASRKKGTIKYQKHRDSMKKIISSVLGLAFLACAQAQVSAVEFGKNRVQYQKFKWKYYQTENFNTYFSQDG